MSSSRTSRRLTVKALKKHLPSKALENPSDLPGRVQVLEQHLQELAEAHATNTAVFDAGFDSTDRRIFTLMRIQEERMLRPHELYLKDTDGKPLEFGDYISSAMSVDWMRYFAEYEAIRGLIKLVEGRNHTHEKTVDETVEELGVTVFGGDGP